MYISFLHRYCQCLLCHNYEFWKQRKMCQIGKNNCLEERPCMNFIYLKKPVIYIWWASRIRHRENIHTKPFWQTPYIIPLHFFILLHQVKLISFLDFKEYRLCLCLSIYLNWKSQTHIINAKFNKIYQSLFHSLLYHIYMVPLEKEHFPLPNMFALASLEPTQVAQ